MNDTTVGYFHYKKICRLYPNEVLDEQSGILTSVLTVYYEISPSSGELKYSCSLWKKEGDTWNRRQENSNAYHNFRKGAVVHKFPDFTQGDLKLDDVWLKKYIHKYICAHGRQLNVFYNTGIEKFAYKTIPDCYLVRGHTYKPINLSVLRIPQFPKLPLYSILLSFVAIFFVIAFFE